jgi:hypothetical protein
VLFFSCVPAVHSTWTLHHKCSAIATQYVHVLDSGRAGDCWHSMGAAGVLESRRMISAACHL